jgi:hypothetical protein
MMHTCHDAANGTLATRVCMQHLLRHAAASPAIPNPEHAILTA